MCTSGGGTGVSTGVDRGVRTNFDDDDEENEREETPTFERSGSIRPASQYCQSSHHTHVSVLRIGTNSKNKTRRSFCLMTLPCGEIKTTKPHFGCKLYSECGFGHSSSP
eukprot:1320822-Rhodomonas_salina.1